MNRYNIGRRFEYRIKKWFEDRGFFVVRSAGSRGLADLVAIKGKEVILVQCKAYKPSQMEVLEYKRQKIEMGISYPLFIFYKDSKGNIKQISIL